jgi:hypothetical protein
MLYGAMNVGGGGTLAPDPLPEANWHFVGSSSVNSSGYVGIAHGWGWQKTAGASITPEWNVSAGGEPARLITVAIRDDGTGDHIPTYLDPSTDPAYRVDPYRGFHAPFSHTDVNSTGIATTIDGLTVANASEQNLSYTGVNKWSQAAGVQGSANSYAYTHARQFSSTEDLSWGNGLVMIGVKTYNAQDGVEINDIEDGGIFWGFWDTEATEEWRVWKIASRDNETAPNKQIIALIDPTHTDNEWDSSGTPDETNWEGSLIGTAVNTGTTQTGFSQLTQINEIQVVGGSSEYPVSTSSLFEVLNSDTMPYAQRLGENAMLVYVPVRIGGGEPVEAGVDAASIQFVENYSEDKNRYNVHIPDNKIGIEFDGNSGDTIAFTNCAISSETKFYFTFASGLAGTYDFTGTTVTNAGTVTLRDVSQAISYMSFNGCDEIDLNDCQLEDTVISNSTATYAMNIDDTTEAADLKNLTFINNNVAGPTAHSIKFDGTGSHNVDNYKFTNPLGRTAFGFHTNDDVDASNDEVDYTAHGYSDGDAVYYQKHSGTDIMGLTNSTLYYVNAQTADALSFHTSEADAISGSSKVNLSQSGGSETHWIYSAKADCYNGTAGNITYNVQNGGDTPTFRNAETAGAGTTGFDVQNVVNVTVTARDKDGNAIQNARVYLYKTSDSSVVLTGLTNASGVITTTFNYTADTAVEGWVRKMSSGDTRYKQFDLAGSISSTGYDTTATLTKDQSS